MQRTVTAILFCGLHNQYITTGKYLRTFQGLAQQRKAARFIQPYRYRTGGYRIYNKYGTDHFQLPTDSELENKKLFSHENPSGSLGFAVYCSILYSLFGDLRLRHSNFQFQNMNFHKTNNLWNTTVVPNQNLNQIRKAATTIYCEE